MSDKAKQLAEKLHSEGEKTLSFFQSLPTEAWTKRVYADGASWNVRGVFEHLSISEHTLRLVFEQIVATGVGSPEGYDVNGFNHEKTGRFATLSLEGLSELYANTRMKTVAFARELSDDQLAIRARHPALGDTSLEEMLKLVYLHNLMHTRDVKKVLPPASKGA